MLSAISLLSIVPVSNSDSGTFPNCNGDGDNGDNGDCDRKNRCVRRNDEHG